MPGTVKAKSKLKDLASIFCCSSLIASLLCLDQHVVNRKPYPNDFNAPTRTNSLPVKFPVGSASDGPDNNNSYLEDQNLEPGTLDAKNLQLPPVPQEPPPPPPPPQIPPPPPPSFVMSAPDSAPDPNVATRLQKRRSQSFNAGAQQLVRSSTIPAPNLMPQPNSPLFDRSSRSSSARSDHPRLPVEPENRAVSMLVRPSSSSGSQSQSPTPDAERRGRSRKSWFPGARSRSQSIDTRRQDPKAQDTTTAWILGQNTDYNTSFLSNRERVPELWNENGDVLVYLDVRVNGGSPSFKVPSFVTQHSLMFADLIEAESPWNAEERARSFIGRDSLSVSDATRRVPSPTLSAPIPESNEIRLYLPVSPPVSTGGITGADLERLICIRNVFAFLTGQPLVATKSQPTLFAVFLNIAALLKEFEFTNEDGSTFGNAAEMSFSFFIEQMGLADVRQSLEKTLESLILGERMRSMELYNEAFCHAVGKYSAMRELPSALWVKSSLSTRQRLERAHFDLVGRQNGVNNQLETFDFPALFTGTANSTSSVEYKDIKFNNWRKAFGRMKQFVLGYYKGNFGSWPPKARSKKNPFTESGLNRQVLKILYSDLCALYDLLADRESLTTRVIDQTTDDIPRDTTNPRASAMRKILSEFDQSSPPVLPPIPFDLPRLPDMASVQENFHDLSAKEQAKLVKNLQEYQIILILNKAYHFGTATLRIPFLEQFKDFELKEAKGKTVAEMADHRLGYWLFLYVVIQSLPMLVVDAPGLKYTEGVEYFLCQPPKGSPPWIEDAPAVRKRWYEVAGSGGLVELSEDAVEFGIEGIYHRSHCWLAAKQWEMGNFSTPPLPANDDTLFPLEAPQSVFEDMDPGIMGSPSFGPRSESPQSGPPGLALRSRTGSPAGRHSSHRSSVAFGLEPVSLPMNGLQLPGNRMSSVWGGPGGARPASIAMRHSRSFNNLNGYGGPNGSDSRSSSRQDSPGVGGSTFDDILKDMAGEAAKQPKKKKGLF
ncbi:hypothetical protein GGR50DRAFT_241356 [Xylaria sp. CBS 124048]|nr:hypothetical protein GGR50DRAFT_241356 [Xylaria sp. CBS 124048]